jgi:maltooligosyltrehalose trehalohydrolase
VKRRHGAFPESDGVRFSVWASRHETLELHLLSPVDRIVPMTRDEFGFFEAFVSGVTAGATYKYRFADGRELPDPASRSQPDGVHGASAVVSIRKPTEEHRAPVPLERYVIYEAHIGTFTRSGNFEGAARELTRLHDIGITALEVMPIAQFPGARNWGYDGVYVHAVQNSYGGPAGFAELVDAAHRQGIAVILDVVYNHLGPEGNYLGEFADYFTDKYKTPWGLALNFDGPGSDHVRSFFIENALMWFEDYGVDALRLDAVHAIVDHTAYPFLAELADAVHASADRRRTECYLIAESDLNDPKVIRPREEGGFEHDAQWSDDFHHSLHTLLTGESDGYYSDFGGIEQLASVLRSGYAYRGNYSRFRQRRYGAEPGRQSGKRFVVCSQNHDQIGNRMLGERLSALVSFERLRLAAGMTLLSPFIPMLFMGEEHGDLAPFLYFMSHSDPGLVEAVRHGRKEEFAAFAWKGEAPDPASVDTFERSRILRDRHPRSGEIEGFHRELLRIRREHPAFRSLDSERRVMVAPEGRALALHRSEEKSESLLVVNFDETPAAIDVSTIGEGLSLVIESGNERWGGGPKMPAVPHVAQRLLVLPLTVAFYAR